MGTRSTTTRRSFLASTAGSMTVIALRPGSTLAMRTPANDVSSPVWQVLPDGRFSLRCGPLALEDAYPWFDDRPVLARRVRIERAKADTRIVYELERGTIVLQLRIAPEGPVLQAHLEGRISTPHWFYPLGQAQVTGADRFFKQGLGFSGPSGMRDLSGQQSSDRGSCSFDSYLTAAIAAPDNSTLAVGALTHTQYLQRTTLYNRQRRYGLVDRHIDSDNYFIDAGFALECTPSDSGRRAMPPLQFTVARAPFEALRALACHIAQRNSVSLRKPPRYHWCSFYEFRGAFTLERLEHQLAGMQVMNPPSRVQTIQIDGGYCQTGDWLIHNDRWPGGLRHAFTRIREHGYEAGIWVAPFMVSGHSQLFKEHPDWMVRDAAGEPLKKEGHRPSYFFDASHPDALAYLEEVFATLRSWGASFFKTDFLDHGLHDSVRVGRARPGKTSVEYYVGALRAIRRGIGDDSYWLGCIAPFAPMVGFVDGMRVANDTEPAWNEGCIGNMLQEMVACHYMNHVLWQNDPDVLYLRDYGVSIGERERESVILFDGIIGGSINTSDRFHTLTSDQLRWWRFVHPGTQPTSAVMPYWGSNRATIVLVRDYGEHTWGVLLLNPGESPVNETCPLVELTGHPAAYVHRWQPGRAESLGELRALEAELKPHESVLYYVSRDGSAPPDTMGISGRTD
jgi:hypothetical protein